MKKKKGLRVVVLIFAFLISTVFLNIILSSRGRIKFCTKRIRTKRIRKLGFDGTVLQNYLYYDSGFKNKLVIKLASFEYTGDFITYKEFKVPKGYDLICDSYLMVKDSTLMVLQGQRYKCLDNGRIYSRLGDAKIYVEYIKGKYRIYR